MSQLTIEVILFVLMTILGSSFLLLYFVYKNKRDVEECYKNKAILDIFSFFFICFGIFILFSNTVNFIKYLVILKYGN